MLFSVHYSNILIKIEKPISLSSKLSQSDSFWN